MDTSVFLAGLAQSLSLIAAVLIGTGALAHAPPSQWVFGTGAAPGSLPWLLG